MGHCALNQVPIQDISEFHGQTRWGNGQSDVSDRKGAGEACDRSGRLALRMSRRPAETGSNSFAHSFHDRGEREDNSDSGCHFALNDTAPKTAVAWNIDSMSIPQGRLTGSRRNLPSYIGNFYD